MTQVFRVECANGGGMYVSTSCQPSYEMIEEARHPSPDEDVLLAPLWQIEMETGNYKNFSFTFASLEQLKFWIYREDWRKELDENGFRVSVYETDSAKIGDTQAVFLKSQAKLEYTLSLLEI